MHPTDPYEAALREVERVRQAEEEARRVLREAKAVYGPAETPVPAPPSSPLRAWYLDQVTPDRWVTLPLWIICVSLTHLVACALCLAGMGFATAVLVYLGSLFDAATGLPLGRLAAFGVGGLATLTYLAATCRSFLTRIRQCPW